MSCPALPCLALHCHVLPRTVEPQEVLFTLIKELSDAHPEIKNPEQSAALLGGIKVELPSERERELMQQIAEMRCKVATLVDNVITYRKRNAQVKLLPTANTEVASLPLLLFPSPLPALPPPLPLPSSPPLLFRASTCGCFSWRSRWWHFSSRRRREKHIVFPDFCSFSLPPPVSRVPPNPPSPRPPFPPPTCVGEADGDISAEEGGERIISSFLTSALSPSLPFPVFLRSLPQRVGASVREAGGGISAEEGGERKAGRGAETREVT
ncbi:unnamed protein product [Closterium sp. NIES-65]|nr:unnamed protein product [Closterium sp. NIES-65]